MAVSLQTRLLVSLVILVSSTLAIIGYVLIKDADRRLEHFHVTQAKYQAQTLADGSLDALVTEDFELLERWVRSAMPSEEYAYAALIRPDGMVLTHTNMDLIGHKVFTPNTLDTFYVRKNFFHHRPVTEIVYPAYVGIKHLANAHVAYYTDMKNGLADESVPWIISAVLLTLVIMTFGSYVVTRRIINPINYLTQQVSDVSPDKHITLEQTITQRKDEVGALARTFISMSRRLFEAYQQLKQKSVELEQRVQERTCELVSANRNLWENEKRISAIVDNIADGVVTTNKCGIIESCNLATLSIFGYSSAEFVGQNIGRFLVRPDGADFCCLGFGASTQELTAIRNDGGRLPVEFSASEIQVDNKPICIFVMRDITERKATMANLEHLANHDILTGLYNRNFFHQELERVVQKTKRDDSEPCAILYIDLDNFKYVNDTLGHAAGDRVLTDVTRILENRARKSDILCRMGGDEFTVLVFDVNPNLVKQVADAFRQNMADYVFKDGKEKIDVGCSIGIAMITKDTISADEALAHADYACFQAKRAGRNCIRVFELEDKSQISAMSLDMGWSRKIKRAMEDDLFAFVYQPILTMGTMEINTVEVLLRMKEADGKLIPPGGFLPAAERFGLTAGIDSWVIRHAIQTLARESVVYPELRFSINISPTSLLSGDLCQFIKNILTETEVDPRRVTFEVTENVAISDLENAAKQLQRIKELGFKIALDDYGSGYASFSCLEQLPLDIIKIDGRYIRDLAHNDSNQKMVVAMGQIGHALGIEVVAEFVQDEDTLLLLPTLGIGLAQGYYVGMPCDSLAGLNLKPTVEVSQQARENIL